MSSHANAAQEVPERRTHAERTAVTRERVMTAVVEAIADVGFKRTTAAEISRRAGVTWGAVQHHFGDKNGILKAVLDESFDHLAAILGEAPEDGALDMRVSLFVDRGWTHFSSALYRSTFEILLNLPAEFDEPSQWETTPEWRRIWSRYFPESESADQHAVELMLYAVSVFTGLATTQMLEGNPNRRRDRELGLLKDTLVRELQRNASP